MKTNFLSKLKSNTVVDVIGDYDGGGSASDEVFRVYHSNNPANRLLTILRDNKVGIGISLPTALVHAFKSQNAVTSIYCQNDTAGTAAVAAMKVLSNSSAGFMAAYDNGHSDAQLTGCFVIKAENSSVRLSIVSETQVRIYAGGVAADNFHTDFGKSADGQYMMLYGKTAASITNNYQLIFDLWAAGYVVTNRYCMLFKNKSFGTVDNAFLWKTESNFEIVNCAASFSGHLARIKHSNGTTYGLPLYLLP